MKIGADTWGYSNEQEAEHYHGACSTREEAIAEAVVELDLQPGDTFYVIRGRWPDPSECMPDAERILDWAQDSLPDVWNVEDQELEVTGGTEELNEFLRDWARRNLKLSCWVAVDKAEAIVVAPQAKESA